MRHLSLFAVLFSILLAPTFAWAQQVAGSGAPVDTGTLRVTVLDQTRARLVHATVTITSAALAARGWVWLAYDHDLSMLTTVVGDAQNTFPVWNATPVLALHDVYEHAYWLDYGRARAKYIDAFFNNLDWDVVAANLERALSMQPAGK